MISIFEPSQRNSGNTYMSVSSLFLYLFFKGIIGGKFLEATRITKPGSAVDTPEFYGPGDFAIGSVIHSKLL